MVPRNEHTAVYTGAYRGGRQKRANCMKKYKLIIEYRERGNNKSQIATLCGCSRTTVWQVLQRADFYRVNYADVKEMSDDELSNFLFPERTKPGDGYLIPDFKWEEIQMQKHRSSIRLCWRRYCKRALKQNLRAYSWKSFLYLYKKYKAPRSDEDDPRDKVRNKLKHYNFILSLCYPNGEYYRKILKEKKEWLKSLKLEEDKILDNDLD